MDRWLNRWRLWMTWPLLWYLFFQAMRWERIWFDFSYGKFLRRPFLALPAADFPTYSKLSPPDFYCLVFRDHKKWLALSRKSTNWMASTSLSGTHWVRRKLQGWLFNSNSYRLLIKLGENIALINLFWLYKNLRDIIWVFISLLVN